MKLSGGLEKGQAVSQRVQRLFTLDNDHLSDWRKEARQCYDFVAGHQWTDDEIQTLKDQKRPVVTFNRTKTVIDAVTGHERSNRREVRFIPREMGDVKSNELLTGAAEWFRDQAHAESHESDAFADQIITGLGVTETRIDFDEDDDGMPLIERVSPFEICYDHKARNANLTDARRWWRYREIPVDEARDLVGDPSALAADLDARWVIVPTEGGDESHRTLDGTDDSDRMVTVVHLQWKERRTFYEIDDPFTGQRAELTSEEYQTLQKRLGRFNFTPMRSRKRSRMVRMQALLGRVVLMVGEAPSQAGFSFNAMTGFRDQSSGTFYGMVRTMIDPQVWANKWLSQTLHIMNTNAKGGLMAERAAFENTKEAENNWSDPSKITWLNDGALRDGRVKEKTSATMPAGFKELTEFAVSSIRDVTGVSLEVLGMREANQAASLEYQRRQSGMTILQPVFDSLKRYREGQGATMLDLIQNDLSDGRLIRIVGQEGEQYVPLMRQADAKYDIIVDDAPNSPNHKEMVWQLFMQMLPTISGVVPPEVMTKMLEYSPFPSGLVKEVQEMVGKPDPQQQQAQALGAAQAEADLAKTQSEAVENQADAEFTRARAATEMAQAAEHTAAAEMAQIFGGNLMAQ